jgi:hypothetical protein
LPRRHTNQRRGILCHEKPRAGLTQGGLKTRDARPLMRPHTAAASEVRLYEHRDCCVEIRIVTSPDSQCHGKRLDAHLGQCSGMTPDDGLACPRWLVSR